MDYYVTPELVMRSVCTAEEKMKLVPLMKHIVSVADRVRRAGLLDIDGSLSEIKDHVYRLGLQLVLDGSDPADIHRILNNMLLSSGQKGIRLLAGLMAVSGVLLIQDGMNPRLIEVELASLAGGDYEALLQAVQS